MSTRRLRAAAFVCCMAVSACAKPSADEHFRKANAHAEQSRMSEAILEYRLALQADPRRGDVRLKLGDAYVRTLDMSNALSEYVRAAELLPNDASAQIKAGNLLLLAKRFVDAQIVAAKAVALEPKSIDALILLGNALAGLKELDGALAEFQEAAALDPTHDAAYLNIGSIQMALGQRAEAESTFRKAVDIAPKSVNARMALASFLWATGRAAEAEHVFKNALALDPSNLQANRALGIFYLASNRAEQAEPYVKAIAALSKTTETAIALADFYGAMRRFDDARHVLKDLSSKQDVFAAATTRLAVLDAAQGYRAEASAKVRQVLDKVPKDAAARLLGARLLLADGKPEEALVQAKAIVADDPGAATTDAYLLIGRIQAGLDHQEEAIAAYEEILRRQSRPLVANLALAGLHLAAGSLDAAMTYAQQARTLQPRSPLARALIVRILLAQKNSRADEELASLQKDFPNAPTVLNLMAVQHLVHGRTDAARASYAKALTLAPTDLEATSGLTQLDLSSGRVTDALNRVETIVQTTAPNSDFLMLAGQTYASAGDADKAAALLKQAIALEPARLRAYSLLGALYARQHRLDEAKSDFGEIVKRNPTSVSANTMLGLLLEAEQRPAEAEKQYQKVLAIDSRAPVAANNLAWLYVASHRNLDEALHLAQTALQRLPEDPDVNDTLGWIYYQKNLTSTAIRYLESSVQKRSNEPAAHYHLGMAYERAGAYEKARKELQQALAFNIDFDGAAQARETLTHLNRR